MRKEINKILEQQDAKEENLDTVLTGCEEAIKESPGDEEFIRIRDDLAEAKLKLETLKHLEENVSKLSEQGLNQLTLKDIIKKVRD